MITRKLFSFTVLMLWSTLFNVACDSDNDTDPTDSGPQVVPSNPDLNHFILTTRSEELVRVDTKTGVEQVIYTFDESDEIADLPDYENGIVYFTTENNSINALDIESGKLLWEKPMLKYQYSSSDISGVVYDNGICYATNVFGVVIAADAASGQIKWYHSLDSDGELDNIRTDGQKPVTHQERLYVVSESGFLSNVPAYLHVLDKNTGQFFGKITLPVDMTGQIQFTEDMLLIPAENLYALDIETLELRWTFNLNGASTPGISGDRIVVHGIRPDSKTRSSLYCLDSSTGALQWSLETGADDLYTPIVTEDVVFAVHDDGSSFFLNRNGRAFAVNISDGEKIWFNDDLSIDTSPVLANGQLFFFGHNLAGAGDNSENVGLCCLDANTGNIVWLNSSFRLESYIIPLVVAQNGTFGPGYYKSRK